MATDRLLYRVPEAAAALGLSRAKVNQLIASGELGSIKIDYARRVPVEALREFVDRRRGAGTIAGGPGGRNGIAA